MKRIFTLALVAGCATAALAQDHEYVSGTYHLRVSDQIATLARTMGQPTPDGALLLGPDGIFELVYHTTTENYHRFGQYHLNGDSVVFRFRNRSREFVGSISEGRVLVNGLEYRRDGWRNGDPNFTPEGRPRIRIVPPAAVFAPDPDPLKFPSRQPEAAPAPAPPVNVAPFEPIGTWSVRNKGGEDLTSRMTFDKDGNFSFTGHGAKSKGHYTVHEGFITLVWTQIDDDAVEEGTVKKDVPICADRCGFDIDTYHYERCSQQG